MQNDCSSHLATSFIVKSFQNFFLPHLRTKKWYLFIALIQLFVAKILSERKGGNFAINKKHLEPILSQFHVPPPSLLFISIRINFWKKFEYQKRDVISFFLKFFLLKFYFISHPIQTDMIIFPDKFNYFASKRACLIYSFFKPNFFRFVFRFLKNFSCWDGWKLWNWL